MFGRQMRLRRYRRRLNNVNPQVTDSARIAQQLADLWRGFRVKDLAIIPQPTRSTSRLSMWYPNLPELLVAFQHHNHLIREQRDGTLEQRAHRNLQTRHSVILDFYFADNDHLGIVEIDALRRLQGLLQEHVYLLNQQESHYYQRLSEMFYEDILTLTHTLITATTEETL